MTTRICFPGGINMQVYPGIDAKGLGFLEQKIFSLIEVGWAG
jgi:hypothetical protein